MSVSHIARNASIEEIAAEMDRRGKVIENLEGRLEKANFAFKRILAVPCVFGGKQSSLHYEDAAYEMKEIAQKARKEL